MNAKPLSNAEITVLSKGLNRLAHNLWWTWSQDAQEVFSELSPRGWQNLYHNAVAILHEVSDYELRVRLQDPLFAARVRKAVLQFDAYMAEPKTWAAQRAPRLSERPVAYFTASDAANGTHLAHRKGREIIVQHIGLGRFAFEFVEALLIDLCSQRHRHQRLSLAPRKQRRAMRPGQHRDVASDRADFVETAPVQTFAVLDDLTPHFGGILVV